MPDPTPLPAFVPPDQAALAERQKRMAEIRARAEAAQAGTTQESSTVPAQAVPAATTAPSQPTPVIQGSDKTLMEMQTRERVPEVQLLNPPPKPLLAAKQEALLRPAFDPLGVKGAVNRQGMAAAQGIVDTVQGGIDTAARAGVAPSQFASETTRKALEQSAQSQQTVNRRVTDFLKTRGYDEPVSLVGDKINLPATVQRMEAAALTKRAQGMGYGDWFQVPPGPDAEKIRQQVNEQVSADLRHATTVGRGAIFVDPDPARTEEWLSTLPAGWAVTLASVLPHAEATWTPKGAQLRTEPVIATALRPVGAPVAAAAALGKAALNTGLVDKWGAAKELSAQAFQAESAGDVAQGDILHQQAEDARAQALNDALGAVSGRADWRDIFLDPTGLNVAQDPDVVKNLVQVTRADPMAIGVTDQLADDIERVYKLDGLTMDAIRGTLWGAGGLVDFFGPEPVTPLIASAGAAARYGMRLEGAADDLLKGAKAIRETTAATDDIQGVMDAARAAYPGMEEALKLRIAARARVQPSVVHQVRALEVRAKELAAKVPVAEAKLVEAREATDIAAAGRELAQARADAALAQTEMATAHRAFTEDALAQWDVYGADNVRRAEGLMATVDDLKRQARAEEANVRAAETRNAPRRALVDERNRLVAESEEVVQREDSLVAEAQKAVVDAKARTKAARTAKDKAAVEAAQADQKLAEQALAGAKERKKQAVVTYRTAAKDAEETLRAQAPYIQEQMRDTERLLRLQKQAAQAESEAGWRILSVADDGKAADHALENSQGVLREAGLMPDINPLDAKSTREMIERGKLWGQGLRDSHAEAGRRVGAAMDDYRKANSMLRGATRETREAAEAALDRLRALGKAQYGREIAEGRAKVWREEALALADDVERGVASLKRRPKDTSERATNLLDGAIVDTAKDGTRTLDTAAFRAKIEGLFTKDGVAWWLRHAGDDAPLWRQALGFEPKGDWSYSTAMSPTIKLSPGEALALQEGQRGLLQGLQRTAGDAAAVNQTEALLALRRDPGMTGPGFMKMTPEQWGQYVDAKYENWKRMLDPMVAKVGDSDEAVVRVSRMGAQRAAIVRDELLMIGRLARAPQGWKGFFKRTSEWGGSPEIIAALGRYMDSTEAMEVFGRTTIANRGPETLWSKTRRQTLNSSALDEAGHDAAYRATESGAQTESDIANRPLLGLSRIWWPPGVQMNSRASARLWGAAIEELKRNDTFTGFVEAMKRQTQAVTGGAVEYIPDRAYSFGARNAAQAAVQADMGDMMVREIGGLFTAEEAADVNRALHADGDLIESPERAWEGFARMGAPFTQASTKDAARAVAQQQELVRIATTRSGEDVFALATQSRALDDTLDKVIKETFARNAGSRNIGESTISKHALDLQQWWKTSVTIGLIGPNPRYFMNNFFGNISQIWLTQGAGTALRMGFQGAMSFLPGVGMYFDRAMRASSEAMTGVPVLGSMMNALINPNLNKFFGGNPGTFTAKNGIVYDLDTVRQWAADDGVLTSFMQEEYGRLFARSRGNSMVTRFGHLQDDLYAWANEIEIRQRSALYLDLLRQGYTRSAARERTLRALYDWHGALTPFESSYVTTAIPFYRFMKLGFRQAWYEAIAKPLIKPTEATAEALRGSSGLARMRNQGMLLRLPELGDDGQYETEADKFDAMSRYRNLDYLNKRIAWTERNDPATIDMYQGGRGQFMPFRTVTLPAMTAIDMGNLVSLTMYALPAMAMGVAGALGMTDQKWTSADAMQPYWDEASNMAGPLAAPWIAMLAQKAGYDSPSQQEIVRLKPGEAALAQSLGYGVGAIADAAGAPGVARWARDKLDFTDVGKDYQSTVGSAAVATVVRGAPGLLQIPQWLDALNLENPHAKQFLADPMNSGMASEYFGYAAGQVTNFTRAFPFDPENNLTQRQTKIAEDLKKTADAQEGSVREKQLNPL